MEEPTEEQTADELVKGEEVVVVELVKAMALDDDHLETVEVEQELMAIEVNEVELMAMVTVY